jgi:hypothetical protein
MSYFSPEDYAALELIEADPRDNDTALQTVANKLHNLHSTLYPRLRNHDLYLYPPAEKSQIVGEQSVTSVNNRAARAVTYFRPVPEARRVERLMGLEMSGPQASVEARRHPVIELRITPHGFTVELVLSPDAWWDQQNMVGKLSLQRHQQAFYDMLCELDDTACLGFWEGTHMDDLHLTVAQLPLITIFEQWMDTFEDSQDWFRVGIWYQPQDEALLAANIADSLFASVKALHNLYVFILWTSNNNFRSFHHNSEESAFA